MVCLLLVFSLFTSSAVAESSFVKKVEKKKSLNQLKQETAQDLQALLTQTIDMVASLTELQKELVSKIQEIVLAPCDSFFTKAKPSVWYQYHADLLHLRMEVEARYESQNKWIDDITHNFQKG